MHRRLVKVGLAVSVLALSAGAVFGITRTITHHDGALASQGEITSTSPVDASSHVDYRVARSVEELAEAAPVIIRGTVESVGGVVNTARHPDDPTRALADVFGLGRMYQVKVEEYLKGAGPTTLTLVQVENYMRLNKENPAVQADPGKKGPAPDIQPMKPGTRYVFFLRRSAMSPDRYLPGMEPYRFQLVGDRAKPEGVQVESSGALPEEDAAQLIARLRTLR